MNIHLGANEIDATCQPTPSEGRLPGALVWFVWMYGALSIIGGSIALTLLSRRFEWGVGHADRPILTVVLVMGIMGMGFLVSVGLSVWRQWRMPIWLLLGVALLSRAVLLPSNLIQESDCYRYVLDGMATINGVNPYRHAPERILIDARDQMGDTLDTPAARLLIARVSFPELPTIYPPLAQGAFALGAALTPWDWRGQRWVFTGLDFIIVLVLIQALRVLGKPVAWAALYAWNPLILKEITNSTHLDSLVALMIVCLTALFAIHGTRLTLRVAAMAGLFFAAAVLSKIYPLILAPVAVALLARSCRPLRTTAVFGFCAVLAIVLGLGLFLSVGWERITESLGVYARNWEANAGAFSVISSITPWGRAVSLATTGFVAIALAWRVFSGADDAMADNVILAIQGTLLAWFLFLPAVFPWYATSLLAVSALRPRPWFFVLSIVFGLYYVRAYVTYHDMHQVWMIWIRVVEHGSVWLALGLDWLAFILRWGGCMRQCESA